MTNQRFRPGHYYAIGGSTLNAIWNEVYMPLITDDGTPMMAIKGDRRRDIAQRLSVLLEANAIEMPDENP